MKPIPPLSPSKEIKNGKAPCYLFSIDLEDIRLQFPGGELFPERVELMTEKYLDFLSQNGVRTTFFVVGEVAEKNPALIRKTAAAGHEIGAHSNRHVPLDKHDQKSFRDDLRLNVSRLRDAGAKDIIGFSAP